MKLGAQANIDQASVEQTAQLKQLPPPGGTILDKPVVAVCRSLETCLARFEKAMASFRELSLSRASLRQSENTTIVRCCAAMI